MEIITRLLALEEDPPPDDDGEVDSEAAPPAPGSEQLLQPAASVEFTIVGLFREVDGEHYGWESGLSHLAWKEAIIPMKSAREFIRPLKDEFWIQDAHVIVDSEEHVETVQAELDQQGYMTRSTVDFLRRIQRDILFITSIVTGLAFAAVAVAALGIANTMAMTVLERTREIGVMKAIGARNRQVLALFLAEGAILGALGSGLGVLVGWIVSLILHDWVRNIVEGQVHMDLSERVFSLPLWLVFGLPLLVTSLTVLASLLPARRAAAIDPISALRSE